MGFRVRVPDPALFQKKGMFHMKRDRGYLRRERAKHIKRRKRISHHYWYVEHDGYLDKGKIHCSCPICSAKTRNKGRTRLRRGNYAPSYNWKHSDLLKIQGMEYELNEYKL